MTSVSIAVNSISYVDGKRTPENLTAECSCVLFFALNETTAEFSEPILSRCLTTIWCDNESSWATENDETKATMQTKMARSCNPEVKAANSQTRIWWQRTQAFVARILNEISAGKMIDVNFEAADMFFALVSAHARRQYNLKMDNTRHWERVKCIIRVLVVIRAIVLVWDSPLSPIIDEPHSSTHFTYVAKHLFATVRDTIFVLGLVSYQWQDNLRTNILLTMRKLWFPNADAKVAAMHTPVQADVGPQEPEAPEGVYVPRVIAGRAPTKAQQAQMQRPEVQAFQEQMSAYNGMVEENKFWMYDSCAFGGVLPSPKGNGGRQATNHELIGHLTTQLMHHLHPRPLATEVHTILTRLLDETETVERDEYDSHPSQSYKVKLIRPAMTIDQDRIRLNLVTILHSNENDPLFRACTDVAGALYASRYKPGMSNTIQYLYGETDPTTPYVWRMVTARVGEAVDAPKVCNPHFFNSGLIALTEGFLKGILGYGDQDPRMMKLFQPDRPYTEIDLDLDTYVALLHANDLGLSHEDQHAMPSNDVAESFRAEYNHFRQLRPLLVYPDCFVHLDGAQWKEHWNRERVRNPAKFLLSTRFGELAATQATHRTLPSIREVLAAASQPPPLERAPAHERAPERAPEPERALARMQLDDDEPNEDEMELAREQEDLFGEDEF